MDDTHPAGTPGRTRLDGMDFGVVLRRLGSDSDTKPVAPPAEGAPAASARKASPAELRSWIDRYTPMLMPIARAFAGGPDDPEDILQAVWIKALEQAHARTEGAPLERWLRRVTLNEGRSRLRRRQRRKRLLAVWRADVGQNRAFVPPESDEFLRGHAWRAIGRLPSLQRRVVLLRLFEDLSVRETADAIDRKEGTVKASYHRAMIRLRRELGPLLESEDDPRSA